jgi:hypothetical protein
VLQGCSRSLCGSVALQDPWPWFSVGPSAMYSYGVLGDGIASSQIWLADSYSSWCSSDVKASRDEGDGGEQPTE